MGYGAKPCADERPAERLLGRPPKRPDQRGRILEAAAHAIASAGYEQCSLARVARTLGLTRPALYHYFPTKQRIFTEIALSTAQAMTAHVQAAVDDALSSTQQLRALMIAYAEYFEAQYWMVSATLTGDRCSERLERGDREAFLSLRRACMEPFEQTLRRGMATGELRSFDVSAALRCIFQLIDVTGWFRPDGTTRAADFASDACALLLDGLRGDAPSTLDSADTPAPPARRDTAERHGR
jgi:TetR/AcrR family transcriptional regulator, cholesterol catabolism regulator